MDKGNPFRKLVPIKAEHLKGDDGKFVLVVGDDGMGRIVDTSTSTVGELFVEKHLRKQRKWTPVEKDAVKATLEAVRPLLRGLI